jgi:hypothetical protein
MKAAKDRFPTEADLCAAFIAWVRRSAGEYDRGIQTPEWTAYPETEGWDILLVGGDGTQIGIQAKLKFNLKVLDQTVPDCWSAWHHTGPDYRAVLVPDDAGYERLCNALGIIMFRCRGLHTWGRNPGGFDFTPGLDQQHHNGGWHYWNPEKRLPLPRFVPDVVAGASGPVQLTKWKIAALSVVARLELRGHVTRSDFREVGVDIRRWVGPNGWLRAGAVPGQFVAASAMPFAAQHPEVYPQVLAEERAEIERRAALLAEVAA